MLKKSKKFGTVLTVGPRLKKFIAADLGDAILWSENYPEQEKPTHDGRGEFQHTREWIETAPLDALFDVWCRGQDFVGYADTILETVEVFNRIYSKKSA